MYQLLTGFRFHFVIFITLRILRAGSPTSDVSKSAPDASKIKAPDSPARALANVALPVPAGPEKRIPLGNSLASLCLYSLVFFRNSTTSLSSFIGVSK